MWGRRSCQWHVDNRRSGLPGLETRSLRNDADDLASGRKTQWLYIARIGRTNGPADRIRYARNLRQAGGKSRLITATSGVPSRS